MYSTRTRVLEFHHVYFPRGISSTIIDLLSGVQGASAEAPLQADGRPARLRAVGLAHCRKRGLLRSVHHELTKQQGYMLAQVVMEIPAA